MLESALLGLIIIGAFRICFARPKKKPDALNDLRREYKAKRIEEVENN